MSRPNGAGGAFAVQATDDLTINVSGDYDRRGQNYNDPQFNYVSADPALDATIGGLRHHARRMRIRRAVPVASE